ncbi:MAG TPA: hypothetical protein VEL76_36310 [Gemmataceae bacterium]|nr:hypothetical protein [Gemmataceae bacterium]
MAGQGADDPAVMLRRHVYWQWLQLLNEPVRADAPSPEELAVRFGPDEGEDKRHKTAERVAEFLRAVLACVRRLWS